MHGERMRRQLADLLAHGDQVPLPSHGRYVHSPAVTNEEGGGPRAAARTRPAAAGAGRYRAGGRGRCLATPRDAADLTSSAGGRPGRRPHGADRSAGGATEPTGWASMPPA